MGMVPSVIKGQGSASCRNVAGSARCVLQARWERPLCSSGCHQRGPPHRVIVLSGRLLALRRPRMERP
jgi:hypothetical protein